MFHENCFKTLHKHSSQDTTSTVGVIESTTDG